MHRHRWVLGLACVALFGLRADADDASDRAGYLSDINSNLSDAASRLSSLASASDDGYLRSAEANVDKVRELVARLADKKGDDAKAREVADRYPRYVSDFQTAAKELRTLKAQQPAAAALVVQCKTFNASMTDRAKAAKDDPRGAEDLSDFAKSVGRKAEDMLRDAERTKSDVERSANEVRRFSATDDRWSSVKDALQRAADEISRAWVGNYEQARRECEDVVKRERHPDVERALGQLASWRSGRAELRKNLDAMLALIATKVTDVQSQSSSSEVNGAVEITKQVESLLNRLRDAQGDDPTSKSIAATWPGWTRELRTSLEALRDLKDVQNRADSTADKCNEAERALKDAIFAWASDPTKQRDGLAQLPGRARQLGSEWKTKLEAAKQGDDAVTRLSATAKRFSQSDGPWDAITRRLQSSADRITEHWKTRYAAATAACTNIALGEAHPDVQKALADMQRGVNEGLTGYRALRAEFNSWKLAVDTLRDWTDKDVEDIRQAYCRAPDAGEYAEVNAIADRWATRLNAQWDTIRRQADRIKASADELKSKGRAVTNAPKVAAAVDVIMKGLEKIKGDVLLGSNNPLVKARADYGVQEHERRQSKCTAKEIPISGDYCKNPNAKRTDCRMDCVVVSGKTCKLVEIKPAGADAEALGWKQVRAYREAVDDLFKAKGRAGLTDKLSVFAQCISDDGKSLNLDPQVEPYDFCPKPDDIAPPLPKTAVEIPEEEQSS